MEKDIGRINKNDQSDIVIRIDDFSGKRGLTIREFVTSERYTGFTKAGVRISAEDFPKFKEMINSVTDEDMVSATTDVDTPEEVPKEETKEPTQENLPDY
ncbi:hypothetical protein GOV14_07200 [Candidatus Pacearchaeota archaeon]|nr:hypothetical protein [Candidatus Pacearchaeota archaeon]